MIEIGCTVRVLAPFSAFFPGEYVVESRNEETGAWRIADGIDFDEAYLERI